MYFRALNPGFSFIIFSGMIRDKGMLMIFMQMFTTYFAKSLYCMTSKPICAEKTIFFTIKKAQTVKRNYYLWSLKLIQDMVIISSRQ